LTEAFEHGAARARGQRVTQTGSALLFVIAFISIDGDRDA